MSKFRFSRFWLLATLAVLCGCGKKEEPAPERVPAPSVAQAPAPQAADPRPAIVVLGDSIGAGFGLDAGQSFPDLLQKDLDRSGAKYRVVNMSVSGDTTQDGLARLPMALAERPKIAVLELGGNDGLRGIPASITKANLAQMIEAFQAAGTPVVLAGMSLPPNYGAAFIGKFEAVYKELALQYKVTLIPFLMEGVGGHDEFMQRDGLHPNAEGARKVEALVMKAIAPIVSQPAVRR